MNKLVSKNPIQRFKQGIQRFQNGGIYPNGTYYEKSQNGKIIERGRWQNGKQVPFQPISSIPEITVIGKKRKRSGWSYGFDRSKEGIGDIATMQRKLKAEGYYADDENSADDGKWGQSTENAYKRYLAKQKAMELPPEVVPEIINADVAYNKSKNNAVYSFSGKTLPTPDYGYYSPSSYGTLNPRWLKTAGATNIEGFRNLVNNNNQLKQDLLNRYGENWEQHLFNAAGVNANKRHFGRKSRRLINEALQNIVDTLNNNYMNKVREYDQQYGLYKQGGQLVSRNPIIRFKNKKK